MVYNLQPFEYVVCIAAVRVIPCLGREIWFLKGCMIKYVNCVYCCVYCQCLGSGNVH